MGLAIVTLFFTCSYIIYLLERVHPVDCESDSGKFSNYFNCLWLIIVTVFTVGYGDLTPVTEFGRAISVISSLSGLILSATMIGLIH